jgi:hypothetical protein
MFEEEYEAAKKAGFSCHLVSFEALEKGDGEAAVRRVRQAETRTPMLYEGGCCGTSLTGTSKARFRRLQKRGYDLRVSAEAYAQAHYLPMAYPSCASTGESVAPLLIASWTVAKGEAPTATSRPKGKSASPDKPMRQRRQARAKARPVMEDGAPFPDGKGVGG